MIAELYNCNTFQFVPYLAIPKIETSFYWKIQFMNFFNKFHLCMCISMNSVFKSRNIHISTLMFMKYSISTLYVTRFSLWLFIETFFWLEFETNNFYAFISDWIQYFLFLMLGIRWKRYNKRNICASSLFHEFLPIAITDVTRHFGWFFEGFQSKFQRRQRKSILLLKTDGFIGYINRKCGIGR